MVSLKDSIFELPDQKQKKMKNSSLCLPMTFMVFVSLIILNCSPEKPERQGATLYGQHCAGCHGADLNGASAPGLIKDNWLYGHQLNHFRRNIKYGIAPEMPAFAGILTDREIDTLGRFLLSAQQTPPQIHRVLPSSISAEDYELTVETIADESMSVPWSIEFVDERRALISERDGSLKWLLAGVLDTTPITGLPRPHTASSTGGFMDIALDPAHAKNGWIYLSYSHTDGRPEDEEAPALTRIVRGRIDNHKWVDQQILFDVPDSLRVVGGNRWGCRFLFDDNGYLYFTIGDMAQNEDVQNPGKAVGKVFRIFPDGSIPEDNPYVTNREALPQIFTIGNRNTQGLAQHPVTGAIWSTDHGPMGGDELNILHKGANYGWPVITYGRDYSGETVSELTHQEGMQQPVIQWTPSPGVCPIAFCTSPLFPAWENRLLVGSLAFEELRLLTLEGEQVVQQELLLKNAGRVRDIQFGPDGSLYLVLNGPDRIVRMTPRKNNQLEG